MPIYDEFRNKLEKTLNRAMETAKGATLNRDAWLAQVKDLNVMKRLFEEAGLFVDDSLRHADVASHNAAALQDLTIQQAEDSASAKLIGDNTNLFELNDVGTVLAWLKEIKPDVFQVAWAGLSDSQRAALLAGAIDPAKTQELD